MIVALEKKLEYLKAELLKYNIQAVIYGEYSGYIDALLYDGIMDMSDMTNSAENEQNRGVFLINAHGKSAREIHDILMRKTYSPLF